MSELMRSRAYLIILAAGLMITMITLAAPLPLVTAQGEPTLESTAIPHVVAVEVGGQWVLVDYTITAGEFFIGSALTVLLLFSILQLLLFAYRKRYQ